jgi:Fe2+ transport system protein FeoA
MIKATESKDRGISMSNFNFPSGTIVDVDLMNCEIWTKLVSIGIFPGQRIHIITKNSHNYLVEIKNSKFAIDHNIAEAIFLIP